MTSETPLGLRENPFVAGHDPRWIYPSRERQEALARLRDGVGNGEPFLLVTGEAGIGKTSVLSEALAALGPRACVASITNPRLTRAELLEEICLRFGIAPEGPRSKPQALARLERHLEEIRSRDQVAVLVMDEAHRLEHDLLEEICLLSNREADGRKLLYVVLMGLPRLEETLARPEHDQLRQRIATHCRLHALSAEDTGRYIHHRIGVAGGNGPELFPDQTCLEIHRLSRGIPREINTLAGQAMLRAGREGAPAVAPAHVRSAGVESRPESVGDDPARAHPTTSASTRPAGPGSSPEPRSPDPTVREWVSRFVGPGGPPKIGIRAGSHGGTFLPASEELEAAGATAATAGEHGGRHHSRSLHFAAASRRRWRRRSRALLRLTLEVVAVALLATAVILLPRTKNLASMLSGASRIAATSRTADGTPPAGLHPGTDEATRAGTQVTPPSLLRDTSGTAPAPAERYGIEVASFINRDRAVIERERLSQGAGLPSRMLYSTADDGVTTYRIVLGSFDGEHAAERGADVLLRQGLVNEARVVRVSGRNAKPR